MRVNLGAATGSMFRPVQSEEMFEGRIISECAVAYIEKRVPWPVSQFCGHERGERCHRFFSNKCPHLPEIEQHILPCAWLYAPIISRQVLSE